MPHPEHQPADWIVWYRTGPAAPWRPITEGASYEAATDRSLRYQRAGDYITLPRGQDPNHQARAARTYGSERARR